MLTLKAEFFFKILANLSELRGAMIAATNAPGSVMTIAQFMRDDAEQLVSVLRAMELGATREAERFKTFLNAESSDMAAFRERLRAVQDRVTDDLAERCLVLLKADGGALYEPSSPLWGSEIRSRFPKACFDIDEAGKCLALDRFTASVFHLMRAIEIVLKAIGLSLEVGCPKNDNWGMWLGHIRDEYIKIKAGPDKDFYQDVYQRLDAIKDASRNPTIHVETIYTEEEAKLILKTTEMLYRKIASRMDENGAPV